MKPAPVSRGPDQAAVLQLGRQVAADLVRQAVDPAAALSMVDRFALATLALAVEVETSRRAGVEPLDHEIRPTLDATLAEIERAIVVRLA